VGAEDDDTLVPCVGDIDLPATSGHTARLQQRPRIMRTAPKTWPVFKPAAAWIESAEHASRPVEQHEFAIREKHDMIRPGNSTEAAADFVKQRSAGRFRQ
jgi:hypothetical protein